MNALSLSTTTILLLDIKIINYGYSTYYNNIIIYNCYITFGSKCLQYFRKIHKKTPSGWPPLFTPKSPEISPQIEKIASGAPPGGKNMIFSKMQHLPYQNHENRGPEGPPKAQDRPKVVLGTQPGVH